MHLFRNKAETDDLIDYFLNSKQFKKLGENETGIKLLSHLTTENRNL